MNHFFRRLLALLFTCAFLTGTEAAATPPATWTTGHKKVLIIPVRFTDFSGPSDAPSPTGALSGWGNIANGTMTAEMSAFLSQQSYGKFTVEFTVLPEVDMGVSYTVYDQPLDADSPSKKFTRWYEPGSFADDARARARQAGLGTANPAMYDTDNYDLDIIATGFIPGQGNYAIAVTYGKGIYANVFTVLPHEFGHNMGLSHAWGWSRSTFYAPLPRNTYFENKYGNVFDLMGHKDTGVQPLPLNRDAGAYWKYALGWLPGENIATSAASGTYRIHAFDQGTLDAGKFYAMRIQRDQTHSYWLEYRTALTGADAERTQNGLLVTMGAESFEATAGNTYLIDMTPGSRGVRGETFPTMHDAPLALGRTYSDAEAGIHITPIQKGGTTPESLDVVVNRGPFPGNVAPTLVVAPASVTIAAGVAQTFTATASDANGDTLAYYWEFDDLDQTAGVSVGGSNADTRLATQGTHTWTRAGTYLVRCTVTDMKGGKKIVASQVTVTGGLAAHLTISGVVNDENGNPVAGAVVNNFSVANGVSYDSANFAASGETAADGKYRIQLPYDGPGPNIYKLSVLYDGGTFSCSTGGGTIYVNSTNFTNVNFTRVRTPRTISGPIAVAGRSYDPATDGPLTVTTEFGPATVSSGFWQQTVPDGALVSPVATASNGNYSIAPVFSAPYRALTDTQHLYFPVNIPGQMPETGFSSSGASSDDTVGTVNIPITMKLPPGYTTWQGQQDFFYWIDASSTAEYGVDYKTSGSFISFYGGKVPSPKNIALKIIPTGKPKSKTVVIKMGVANNVSILGQFPTFTYTITNPFQIRSVTRTGNAVNLMWDIQSGVNYTIESASTLSPTNWSAHPLHSGLPGINGTMSRSVDVGNSGAGFFRIRADW